jgi:hypothetical protein
MHRSRRRSRNSSAFAVGTTPPPARLSSRALCTVDYMKNPSTKLALNLVLTAIGLTLICVNARWLFFIGLTLIVFCGTLSLRPRKRLGGVERVLLTCLWIAGITVILWFSSFGRDPLGWKFAAVLMFVFTMTEMQYWRDNRRNMHEG